MSPADSLPGPRATARRPTAFRDDPQRPSCRLISQVLLRGIGAVYLIAIVSLWSQIQGLVGSRGILPIQHYFELVHKAPDVRFWQLPSLLWVNAGDGFLNFLCGAGVVLSLLVIAGIAQLPALALLWVIYLSLTVAGQEFLNFQWDALLLEAGLLAVLFAPARLLPRRTHPPEPSRIILWLIRWLVFRLMFLSGLVKLLSGDPSWRDGTAMNYHYLTQPLPSWTSYWAYQLPGWFQWLSVWAMFGIELVAPLFIFLGDAVDLTRNPIGNLRGGVTAELRFGRRSRQAAFCFLVFLQLLIAGTGNFGFFNVLAILLCVSLLDDQLFPKWLRARLNISEPMFSGLAPRAVVPSQPGDQSPPAAQRDDAAQLVPAQAGRSWPRRGRLTISIVAAAVILYLTTLSGILEVIRTIDDRASLPESLQAVVDRAEPFRSTNGYGLFRVMTQERNEIIIEGSADGYVWKPYEFKYKPGDPYCRPQFCTPHMPRLDWQMWFGAFGGPDQNRWFIPLLKRLLAGEPHVMALMGNNPFPDHPPRYIRAVMYTYTFAPPDARGRWWNRSHMRDYLPPVTLDDLKEAFPEKGVDSP